MNWFQYLYQKGYFNPSENPDLIPVEKGFQIPRWDALDYLEKVASEFRNGQSLENVPAVLEIIENISRNPKDNHSTWYRLMRVLADIPNEMVPASIFDYIPVWLHTRFPTSTQSLALISDVLPKYLSDEPKDGDKGKVEKILYYLFSLSRTETENFNSGRYASIVYLYFLQEHLVNKKLVDKIAVICDFSPMDRVLSQLNLMLRDHDILDKVETHPGYFLKLHQNESTLEIAIENHTDPTSSEFDVLSQSTIDNYFDIPPQQVIDEIIKVAKEAGIETIDLKEDPWKRAVFLLSHDVVSLMNHAHFEDLTEDIHDQSDTMETFALVATALLNSYTRHRLSETQEYIRDILKRQRFQLPFFRRLVIYTVSENYELIGDIFWEMIAENDRNRIFSEYGHFHELFILLSKIATLLTDEQTTLLSNIIEQGPQGDSHYEDKPDTWRHRWLSALQASPSFKGLFEDIEVKLEIKRKIDYADEGKVKMLKGNPSPFTPEDLLKMENEQIVSEIINFKPSGEWDGDTVDGFAETLSKAAEENPDKIVKLMPELVTQPKIYLYQLTYGLTNAWKGKKTFDWSIVLQTALDVINKSDEPDEGYIKGQRLPVKDEWVHLAVARLLSEGMKNDSNAFDPALLPQAEQLILFLTSQLQPETSAINKEKTDYPMRLLNSRAGTVLRALLDYCLRAARLKDEPVGTVRWSEKNKDEFVKAFDMKILETWTLFGMYYPQFMYLDNDWAVERLQAISTEEYSYIEALMGGVAFGNPPGNQPLYVLFYPLYKASIDQQQNFDSTYYHGIIRHVSAFYFWDLEDIDSPSSLIGTLIKEGPVSALDNLAGFLITQFKAYSKSKENEKEKLLNKIIEIWRHIAQRLSEPDTEEKQQVLARLIYLLDYLPKLTPEYTDLIATSAKYADKFHFRHELITELLRLADPTNADEVAKIALQISFDEYLYDDDQETVKNIVRFLYLNSQKETANKISNQIALKGQEFLIPVYQEFNG